MIFVAPKAPIKAGPVGPGAGPLLTEPLLTSILSTSPQKKMRKAWQLGISVPWIRKAEMVISDTCSSVDWSLEDANDEEIDGTTGDIDARRLWDLLRRPQSGITIGKRMTRRDLWALTFRHMGLCGNAFWYLDGKDGLGIPSAILYVRPDRMTPATDAQGNLTGWIIDATPQGTGTRLDISDVIQFMLQPPDEGHFGIGLVESAMLKAQLSVGTDQHAAAVLAAGGRLAGIMSPKTGAITDDNQYRQIVNDARSITEQPDAAKRLQVLRAPVDFTSTAMTMDEAKVVELMVQTRDDLLALWGVPLSQVGGSTPAGLNGGDVRKYDEAALWQNANHPRLVTFTEAIQAQLIDSTPCVCEFEIEEPEFDDDSPRYDLLQKSVNTPMTNKERRELIGLDPFGDSRDDEVWLPMTMAQAFVAPTPEATVSAQAVGRAPLAPDAANLAAGETNAAKAAPFHTALVRIRSAAERTMVPRLRSSVGVALDEQRRDVASWLRTHAAHVAANPKDRAWWNAEQEDRRLRGALAGPITTMAQQVADHIGAVLAPAKAGSVVAATRALTRGATRVTNINAATQDAIAALIAQGISDGLTVTEIADGLAGAKMSNGVPAFDAYRSELIARTELMAAYNGATIDSYGDAGVTMVEAIDGDQDEECAARNGQTFTLEEAAMIEDHPNGTLDWVPVADYSRFGG